MKLGSKAEQEPEEELKGGCGMCLTRKETELKEQRAGDW